LETSQEGRLHRGGRRLAADRDSYDLRHAAVSTWLNAGISPTQVAEWAGQSPEVLWLDYAKCLDGGQAELRPRVEAGYGAVGKPARLRYVLGTDHR
jgi:hypothetical protein